MGLACAADAVPVADRVCSSSSLRGENASVTVPPRSSHSRPCAGAFFIVLRRSDASALRWKPSPFFLCTLSLAVTGLTVPDECPKQPVAILMGLAIFPVLGFSCAT